MSSLHPVLKKLQLKDSGLAALIVNAPQAYEEVIASLQGEVHREAASGRLYDFVQVFGATNDELQSLGRSAAKHIREDGLLWLCYPKKSSKQYKGSDCSRETVRVMLAEDGFESVRQIAIDDDWSALRFRKPEHIKTMVRSFAVTEKGKERLEHK